MQFNRAVAVRFFKGLLATLVAAAIAYTIKVLPGLNLFNATLTSLIVGVLLAVEKSFPNNM